MTGIRTWWAQLRADLGRRQVRYWAATAAAFALLLAAQVLVGVGAVVIVLSGAVVWLLADRPDLAGRCDKATDDADRANGAAGAAQTTAYEALQLSTALAEHLAGTDEPSSGRHAHPVSPTSPRSPA